MNQWTQPAVAVSTSAGHGPGPRSSLDELGFVEPDGRFHERVIQGIPDRADRRRQPFEQEGLGEVHRGVLRPGIGVKPNSA